MAKFVYVVGRTLPASSAQRPLFPCALPPNRAPRCRRPRRRRPWCRRRASRRASQRALPGGARCSARYRAADAPSCRSLTALDKKAAHTKIVLAMLRHENHFAGDGEHVRKDNRQLWTAKAIAAQRGVLQLGRDPSLQNTASGALAWACGQGVLALFKGKPGTFYGPVRSLAAESPTSVSQALPAARA